MNVSTWKIVANGSNPFFGCIQLWKVFFHISLQHVDVVLIYTEFLSPMSEENHQVKLWMIEPFVSHLSHLKKSWYHKMVIFKPWSDKPQTVQNAKYIAEIYHLNNSIEIIQIFFGVITVMKKCFMFHSSKNLGEYFSPW